MIQDFDKKMSQLRDLSEIINKFKSEAVQLRIVELIFGLKTDFEKHDEPTEKKVRKHKPTKKKPPNKSKNNNTPLKSGTKSSGQGAVAILNNLVDEGKFFKTPKTIKDLIAYCDQHMARKFKANEFSGKLSRLVRNDSLTREKNSEDQYEYKSG